VAQVPDKPQGENLLRRVFYGVKILPASHEEDEANSSIMR
jgi:hypothetical protein